MTTEQQARALGGTGHGGSRGPQELRGAEPASEAPVHEARGLALAVAAAFAAAILAISGHADQVEQGYRLAAARREGEVLLREAVQAERRVVSLKIPTAVARRAESMRLGLELQRDRRMLTRDEVAALVSPPPIPVAAPPGRPGEVMAK